MPARQLRRIAVAAGLTLLLTASGHGTERRQAPPTGDPQPSAQGLAALFERAGATPDAAAWIEEGALQIVRSAGVPLQRERFEASLRRAQTLPLPPVGSVRRLALSTATAANRSRLEFRDEAPDQALKPACKACDSRWNECENNTNLLYWDCFEGLESNARVCSLLHVETYAVCGVSFRRCWAGCAGSKP